MLKKTNMEKVLQVTVSYKPSLKSIQMTISMGMDFTELANNERSKSICMVECRNIQL